MLQRWSARVQALIEKATDAHERARLAAFPEDRQFWLDMETRWLSLAGDVEHVERTDSLLAEAAKRR